MQVRLWMIRTIVNTELNKSIIASGAQSEPMQSSHSSTDRTASEFKLSCFLKMILTLLWISTNCAWMRTWRDCSTCRPVPRLKCYTYTRHHFYFKYSFCSNSLLTQKFWSPLRLLVGYTVYVAETSSINMLDNRLTKHFNVWK